MRPQSGIVNSVLTMTVSGKLSGGAKVIIGVTTVPTETFCGVGVVTIVGAVVVTTVAVGENVIDGGVEVYVPISAPREIAIL